MMLEPLSPEGLRRRNQILLMTRAAASQRRNRRWMGRGVMTVCVILLATIVIRFSHPRLDTISPPAAMPVAVISTPAPVAAVAVEYVQTDPTITDRLTLPPQPPRWKNISDTEMLNELAEAGQPMGMVTINGKTFLLPRLDR